MRKLGALILAALLLVAGCDRKVGFGTIRGIYPPGGDARCTSEQWAINVELDSQGFQLDCVDQTTAIGYLVGDRYPKG